MRVKVDRFSVKVEAGPLGLGLSSDVVVVEVTVVVPV